MRLVLRLGFRALRIGHRQVEMRLVEHVLGRLRVTDTLGLGFLHLLDEEQDKPKAKSEKCKNVAHVILPAGSRVRPGLPESW